MTWHTYPPNRAGYYGNEPINLPKFPWRLYSVVCPRCLTTIHGPITGIVVVTEQEGDEAVDRVLGNHCCTRVRGLGEGP